jgi:DNA-binding response OmpR family regulator
MTKRILIVEDDAALARVLRDNLTIEGFTVQWAAEARTAIEIHKAFSPDLVVLDVMLPDGNGFDLCGLLRRGGRTAIIILTARTQKADKLRGLALGADDYVAKPFDLEELLARVQAVLRRGSHSLDELQLGTLSIDFRTLRASRDGQPVHMSYREFEVLRYLAERKNHVVSRHELLTQVWSYGDAPITRSVDHAMARLRKKIEPDPHRPEFIHTVHGDGYCLTPEGRTASDPANAMLN